MAAAAAGKKESVTLSFFMEVNVSEIEEDPSTMPTIFWLHDVWMDRWVDRSRRRVCSRFFEVQTWRQVKRACRSGHV